MEISAFLGVCLGLFAIGLAHVIEGSTLLSLINLPALIVVIGGTFAAILVQTPGPIFKRAMQLFPWFFFPPQVEFDFLVDKIVFWSKKKRQNGLLSIEHNLGRLKDPFLIKGAELLLSGVEKEDLIQTLEYEIDTIESRDLNAAKVYESMGGYSPTLGILGAVLGLIQVMSMLSQPSELGAGIAVAFVATIYGVGFANLFFLPIANRFKMYIFQRTRMYEMYIAGLISLMNDDMPGTIKMKMRCFINQSKE